jgi:hypothetical protein
MALELLRKHGHTVIPVNPGHDEIAGVPAKRTLDSVDGPIDTVTVYVNPERLTALAPDIARLHPHRVILNPGTEDEAVKQTLEQ